MEVLHRKVWRWNIACMAISLSFASSLATAVGNQDLLELESSFVGDREQPNVSYSLPWKGPEGPDELYRDIDSFNENLLEPVDRDLLLRSIRFYDELDLESQTFPDG